MLQTPVLFIVFNRPNTTRQVFEAIRQAKPKQLFVAADGPRPNRPGEGIKCEEVRKIATEVDWDCEVKTLFRKENVGCGRGPAEAISWFFEQVEQGIILEDDCLPSPSFFKYCQELLIHYRNNEDIFLISGTNPLPRHKVNTSYFFSKYAGIWGWASWRRAWKNFNYLLPEWNNEELRNCVLKQLHIDERAHFISEVERILIGELKAWDYQWWFYRLLAQAKGIVPATNLISNIGFGPDATHTVDRSSIEATRKVKELKWPLRHPQNQNLNVKFDKLYYQSQYVPKRSFKRFVQAKRTAIISRIKNLIR